MKKLKGIGKIAICIMVAVLLSSTVYAGEGAVAESVAVANANDGGSATSIVDTEVSIYPDGDGYITTAIADVELDVTGESDATGYAYGEGTTPIDPDGEQANAGVMIGGYASSYDCCSSAGLSGIALASASTEDSRTNTLADINTYAFGNAEADGIAKAWADTNKEDGSDPIPPEPPASSETKIYISSVQFDSPGTDDYTNINEEWVKITNSGSNSVDMTGWILQDDEGWGEDKRPFEGLILEPGATVTVHTGNGQNSDTDRYMGYNRYIWNNEGDTAILKDNTGKIVDQKTCNQASCEY